MSSRLFLFLCFLPFCLWLIRSFNVDIKSEQGRKLKTAALATFPFHLALLLWDLKYAGFHFQLVRAANG